MTLDLKEVDVYKAARLMANFRGYESITEYAKKGLTLRRRASHQSSAIIRYVSRISWIFVTIWALM